MTDQVLDILKLVLLALLYLFFARVLWAVWSEVRQPADARTATEYAPAAAPSPALEPSGRREPRPGKGRGGTPARLVVLEPKERRGTAYAIAGVVSIGRDDGNTIRITDDSYISGHHATVSPAAGHVVVDDLGSRNGTYLNGARISMQRTVQTGDRIQIGYTVLEAQ
jgi:pSer/pThr/pTyr-binding forkhead associated (FHA) protein